VSVLVVGVSHHTTPIHVLDEVAVVGAAARTMLDELGADPRVSEALVLGTCNRLEVYAAAPQFHPALDAIRAALSRHSGLPAHRLAPYLFVHHGDSAAEHLFRTSSGLDSMVTGESQIRFQVRGALQAARDAGVVGPALSDLVETALRVGKRVQTETRIDEAGRSLADEGYATLRERGVAVDGATVVVLGAGSMASVAAVGAERRGAGEIIVINRDAERGSRLAAAVCGVSASWDDLPGFLAKADVLVACTGAAGTLVDRRGLTEARRETSSPLGVLDLAMPHDVDPGVADLPGVELIGMGDLAEQARRDDPAPSSVAAAQAIVRDEVGDYVAAQSAAAAVPTVVALRRRADEVVAAELERLTRRLGDDVDPRLHEEVAATVRRVVGKLLHTPTVRVKDAAAIEGADYEAALRHLFALDPGQVSSVSRRDPGSGGGA
jgi:glutamyl-tRNA reductase